MSGLEVASMCANLNECRRYLFSWYPFASVHARVSSMEVIIQPNQEAAASLVARIVARELRTNPHLVLGLATGQTMECVYRHLVRLHQIEKLDFSLCRTFNLDEYGGVLPSA